MLGSSQLVGFVATTDLDRAGRFYEGVLGLAPIYESPIVRVFNANGTKLRVTLVDELVPAPFTVLGWTVNDIEASVRSLQAKVVAFERFPGMEQDELGVWTTPGGDRVAWFRDPDGNVLSLTQTH
jgi:catechol 2,3-dioxygenase-like lactoylglutathione lyase family enzyme